MTDIFLRRKSEYKAVNKEGRRTCESGTGTGEIYLQGKESKY